jgi:hypothetical protein
VNSFLTSVNCLEMSSRVREKSMGTPRHEVDVDKSVSKSLFNTSCESLKKSGDLMSVDIQSSWVSTYYNMQGVYLYARRFKHDGTHMYTPSKANKHNYSGMSHLRKQGLSFVGVSD